MVATDIYLHTLVCLVHSIEKRIVHAKKSLSVNTERIPVSLNTALNTPSLYIQLSSAIINEVMAVTVIRFCTNSTEPHMLAGFDCKQCTCMQHDSTVHSYKLLLPLSSVISLSAGIPYI